MIVRTRAAGIRPWRGLFTILLLSVAIAAAAAPSRHSAIEIPALVFVSRAPASGADAGFVPGVGPRGRTLATGGRLMLRDAHGAIRPLVTAGRLFDVSDPAVSWDGRWIAFAGLAHRDSSWRIWVVGADGRGLRAVTRTDRRPLGLRERGVPGFARYDDLDPCWLPDGRICFASTRWPLLAQNGGLPVTNLFAVRPDGGALQRITSERNGGEEPSVDPSTGRIVYARWWTNRWLAGAGGTALAVDRASAVPSDTVDVWHAITIRPDGDGGRLAGGDPRSRAGVSAYQPCVLANGTLLGVRPVRLGLETATPMAVQAWPGGFAAATQLAGLGARAASACSPAALPGGAIVLALDHAGRGDYGIWAIRLDGSGLVKVVDLPGTLELDPAPLVSRKTPPVASGPRTLPLPDTPFAERTELESPPASFRFDCMNVFTNGPADTPIPDAPPIARDVRIRFFATLSRPGAAGGDTAVMLREEPVDRSGAVHVEDLPADTPLFEQLVDAHGRVLRAAMSPAHVPGLNFVPGGTAPRCVGCHAGHSALPVPRNYEAATWINAAPSAEVTASSVAPGTSARHAVDRRTRGPADSVAWVAAGGSDQFVELRWPLAIDVGTVVLYALRADSASGTDLVTGDCEIRLRLGDREVGRFRLHEPVRASGSRVDCGRARADRIEIRPLEVRGRVRGRTSAALAEVEILARIADD